jgi:dephospho-CoA kinase
MEIFGLTGGIGSGKSSVARYLAAKGLPLLSADVFAREVVAPGSEGLAAVVEAFGPQILSPDGSLDRAALGKIVFASDTRRSQLEAIVHPRIAARLAQEVEALKESGHRRCVYEIPLLFEQNRDRDFKATILVCAPEEQRVARVQQRDQLDENQVRARLAAQLSDELKRARATYIIENDSTPEALAQRIDATLGWMWQPHSVAAAE